MEHGKCDQQHKQAARQAKIVDRKAPNTLRIAAPATVEMMQQIAAPIEATSATRRRWASDAPTVKERNTGIFAIGFVIAKSAAKTFVAKAKSIGVGPFRLSPEAAPAHDVDAAVGRTPIDIRKLGRDGTFPLRAKPKYSVATAVSVNRIVVLANVETTEDRKASGTIASGEARLGLAQFHLIQRVLRRPSAPLRHALRTLRGDCSTGSAVESTT
jgi:hypothetical protein